MNIVNKLTIRNLKENKRRTLVTIIGVIISVAMVTAVSTLAVSFIDLLKKEVIADSGEWHVLYKDVNKEQLAAIKTDEATEKMVVSTDLGYAALDDSGNKSKPYLFLKAYNTEAFSQFPVELTEGRLPTAANEIVIPEHLASDAGINYQVGYALTLNIGDRVTEDRHDETLGQTYSLQTDDDGNNIETITNTKRESFTVVGVIKRPTWESPWAPGYTLISYIDEEMVAGAETVHATVVLKKPNKSMFAYAEKFAKDNHIDVDSISYNNELLRLLGVSKHDGFNKTLFSLSAIIIAVIMIGSISLIYNAFAISVSERSRQLGMLSSVGATKRQKRNSVFFEGAIIGLISIPLGIISGVVGIGITFTFINSMLESALGTTEKLSLTVTPMSIVVACAISILTIFISTYIPARRASRISAIDAIRQTTDVKLTKKEVKTSQLVRKLFGIEAEIGLKNLKRNKKRYNVTVFSLVVSIVLFLTVSSFTGMLKKSVELTQGGHNYDIRIGFDRDDDEAWEEFSQSVVTLEDVNEYSIVKSLYLSTWVDEESAAKELKNKEENISTNDEKFPYYLSVHTLDEQALLTYANQIGIDAKKLGATADHLPAIVIDTASHYDMDKKKYVETKAIYTKVGHTFGVYNNPEEQEATEMDKIEVAALTDIYPMGLSSSHLGDLNIIVSESSFQQLEQTRPHVQLFLNSSDPLKTQQDIEQMDVSSIYIHNVYKDKQSDEQFIAIVSIFTYGFIVLITAISVANIFNTISTGVALRKREFAMLKSVGMTPQGFNKMINYESIFYGLKSLLYGLPISIGIMLLMHRSLMNTFEYTFQLPWLSLAFVIVAIFAIVGSAMLYSSAKIKKENIIDALKDENI